MNPTTEELRKIDAEIQSRIFGPICHCKNGIKPKFGKAQYADMRRIANANGGNWPKREPDLPCDHFKHYTTDPAAAFELLKKCAEKLSPQRLHIYAPHNVCDFWMLSNCERHVGHAVEEHANTLELAIAQFALKLFGGQQ